MSNTGELPTEGVVTEAQLQQVAAVRQRSDEIPALRVGCLKQVVGQVEDLKMLQPPDIARHKSSEFVDREL